MIPTLKIPLLLLGAWFVNTTIKPPLPPAQTKKGDKLNMTKQKTFEKYVVYWAASTRYGNNVLFLLEAAILVLLHLDRADIVPKTMCPKLPSKGELSTMPPLFIVGITSLYLGSLLRLWCFKTLGNLFTFEISIRPGHKLFTHGPYGIVRHPSYLGILLLYSGMIIVEASPNGYLTSCLLNTYGIAKWIFVGWVAMLIWKVYVLAFVRPTVEDKTLHAAFGAEWEEYAKRVRFKVIPGVF